MHISPIEFFVVAVSAVFGCLATAVAFRAVTGKSASIIALNWRKHVWSIIFALPILLIFHLPTTNTLILLLSVVWLMFVPSVASKYVFMPNDADWSFLLMLHSAYAFATIASVLLWHKVLGLPAIAGF